MAIANSLLKAQRVDEARSHFEQVVDLDPRNVVALNNLAWLVREVEPVKALEYARLASSIAPDSAEVLDTLAVVEYLNKDYKQAGRSIERALRHSPDNPSLLYHSAMISAAVGNKSIAIGVLELLLKSGADFPELDQANALFVALEN